MMKIKAIPIKSKTLCEKCYFFVFGEHCEKTNCKDCENKGESQCHCTEIVMGEPCRYFKRNKTYLLKKIKSDLSVAKCKCGGSVTVQFGFSCSGMPKTTLRCDKCFKSVFITGETNKNLLDIWEGADNGK